ncbi:MAG: hypothetical protein ACFFBV_15570 [Promethearchaeota archaeon]
MSFLKKYEFVSDIAPICPYCEKEINIEDLIEGGRGLNQKTSRIKFTLRVEFVVTSVFFCPHCRKILGIGKWR